MAKSFKEVIKEHGLNDDYFPYAEKGPKLYKRTKGALITIIVFCIILLITSFGEKQVTRLKQEKQIIYEAQLKQREARIKNEEQMKLAKEAEKKAKWEESLKALPPEKRDAEIARMEARQLQKETSDKELEASLAGKIVGAITGFFNKDWTFTGENVALFILSWLVIISRYIIILFTIIFIIRVIRYFILWIKRSRVYERNILQNDRRAHALQNGILRSLAINKRIGDFKRKQRNSKTGSVLDYSELVRIDALKAMKKLKVFINTRGSLTSDKVKTRYRVIVDAPMDADTNEELQKYLKNIGDIATKVAKGKVVFGELAISADKSTMMLNETTEEDDPYLYKDLYNQLNASEVVEGAYETSFPLTLLKDRSDVIIANKEAALQWATEAATSVDIILSTLKINGKRIGIDTGNKSALYTYDMSYNVKDGMNSLDNIAAAIDKNFKLQGSSATLTKGKLQISVPIPSEMHIPINVPTMFKEVFG